MSLSALRKQGKKAQKAEKVLGSTPRAPQAISRVLGDHTPGGSSTTPLPRAARPAPPQQKAHHLPPPAAAQPNKPGAHTSPSSKHEPNPFADFEARKQEVVDTLFQLHTARGLGEPCACNSGATRTTTCQECWNYEPSCPQCFTDSHLRAPTHWANVWHPNRGYFVRHDISALPGQNSIHLGHGGQPCPHSLKHDAKEIFTIVDTNGIHSTKVRFCACAADPPDRVDQLLKARLLPASFRRPRLAFTFAVMHSFHIHHLTSAESAYDFVAALRHMTDSFFFKDAADPYDQFRDAYKIWQILESEISLGVFHGFGDFFPHRRGSLAILCPACIEFGVNTSKEEECVCDPRLRHLFQIMGTLDGNYQANRFIKNTDLKRISFYDGRAYFPSDPQFRVYVIKVNADKAPEKTTCSYLKAINKQDKSKFAGTDISGIVNFQCPHVFILSSVDLQYGERYPVVDYAIEHGLEQRGIPDWIDKFPNLDFLLSYDIGCSFGVHLVPRFEEHSSEKPALARVMEKARPLVPLLHVQNHKDNCMYLYSCAYQQGAGHFHGETAEHPWVYLNQFSGQGQQMCPGNRHDMYIAVISYWNLKKLIMLPTQLHSDLKKAELLKNEKQEVFIRYCYMYGDKVEKWNKRSRSVDPKIVDKNGEVLCVYRHTPSKLPSQKRIYDALMQLADDSGKASDANTQEPAGDPDPRTSTRFNFTKKPKSVPLLLNHSISVRRLQHKIICLLDSLEKLGEGPDRSGSSVATLRSQLQKALKRFRELQLEVTPQVADHVLALDPTTVYDEPETQKLLLPSHYTQRERLSFQLVELGEMEREILEGAAYDSLGTIRTAVRMLGTMHSSDKEDRGQQRHTRNRNKIENAKLKLETAMATYTGFRNGLLSLGMSEDDPTFLPMSNDAIKRKSTTEKRQLGDTYKRDGQAWTGGGINSDKRLAYRPLINAQGSSTSDMVGTQSSQALKRKNEQRVPVVSASKKPRVETGRAGSDSDSEDARSDDELGLGDSELEESDGSNPSTPAQPARREHRAWVWNIKGTSKGLSDKEVEDFISEGDRVQWFRAEAEMLRWNEEWERKLVEFMRSIRYYDKIASVWRSLASRHEDSLGMIALAKKTSNQFAELRRRCEDAFRQAGYQYTAPSGSEEDPMANETNQVNTQQQEVEASFDEPPGTSSSATTPPHAADTNNPTSHAAPQLLTDSSVIPFILATREALSLRLGVAMGVPVSI